MQSTLPRPLSTTSLPSDPLSYSSTAQTEVYPSTLLAAFATVPDPRRRQGARFALSAVLALVVSAILSNHLSVLAIAEWGKSQGCDLLKSLGFSKGITPHQSTLHRLLGRLDPKALSLALSAHFALFAKPKDSTSPPPRASQTVSIDGKAQRGRLAFDSSGGPVHALAAYLHGQGIVLAQEPIGEANQTVSDGSTDKTQVDKAQAELSVAPSLIKRIDWQGRVLTGDALFCQRSLCKQVVESGGDYLLPVKQNQPRIYEDIRLLFNPPSGLALPLDDRRAARTVDHGHGRHYDTRVLVASSDLVGYSDWPNLAQVFSIERTWREKGKTRQEISFGVTSLPKEVADAKRLLELKRGHWQIENCLHYVKDVTLGEDRSLAHLGNGPSVMATLRDLALTLLHQSGVRTIASRLRYHSIHPEKAVAILLNNSSYKQNA